MKSSEIRRLFLEYFSSKDHTVVPSSPLVPEGDPTLLFTNAGMVQFKKVFTGEDVRPYKKAASCQKCVRAGGKHNDLENVGKTTRHHTFFEMLGNFSFGDYFKKEAIELAWELLVKKMRLDENKLLVTIFEQDDEAERIWRETIGLKAERIKRLGEKDNFWTMGDVGPCGPCSEIIIDQGETIGCRRPTCTVGCDCDRFLEVWNLVFMQYTRDHQGVLSPLPRPSIDTGMGLERITAILNGKTSNYATDLFMPMITSLEELSGAKYGASPASDVSIRAIADHTRAIAMLMAEGLLPSNEGRNYVLRRIIRRAIRHGRSLGIKEPFLHKTAAIAIETLSDVYPELVRSKNFIIKATIGEEERFFSTLEKGMGMLDETVSQLKKKKVNLIPGAVAFNLYDTYGFPLDLTEDIVEKDGFKVDEQGFLKEMTRQKEMSRKAWGTHLKGGAGMGEEVVLAQVYAKLVKQGIKSAFAGYSTDVMSSKVNVILKEGELTNEAKNGDMVEIVTEETPFYGESGGQVGDIGVMVSLGAAVRVIDTKKPAEDLIVHRCIVEEGSLKIGQAVELSIDRVRRLSIRRNHTATHILHAALRETLGRHIRQAGSLVTDKGFRFDFNHFSPPSDEELNVIEEKINNIVRDNMEVSTSIVSYEEALKKGALAFFGEKYGKEVRLVSIDGQSKELCGGTHVARTGDIGLIKIIQEGSIAAGVRRIEGVSGHEALRTFGELERILKESSILIKASKTELVEKIRKMIEREKELEKTVETLKGGKLLAATDELVHKARSIHNIKVLGVKVNVEDARQLKTLADALRVKLSSGIVILGAVCADKALILAAVTKDLTMKFSADGIVKKLAPVIGGKGGGKPDMAQIGGALTDKIDEAIEKAFKIVEEMSKAIV